MSTLRPTGSRIVQSLFTPILKYCIAAMGDSGTAEVFDLTLQLLKLEAAGAEAVELAARALSRNCATLVQVQAK